MATDATTPDPEDDEPDTGKRRKRHVSGELAVMADIEKMLDDLDGPAARRVRAWFIDKITTENEGAK